MRFLTQVVIIIKGALLYTPHTSLTTMHKIKAGQTSSAGRTIKGL